MPDTDLPTLPKGASFDNSKVGTKNESDLPELPKGATSERQPISWKDRSYAFGHGLVTGTLGTPGEIESMFTPSAPKGSKLVGHETIFPTQKEVAQGFEKLGIPLPRKDTEGWHLLGELSPAIAGGGKLLYKGGEYLLSRGGQIVSRWRGKPLEEASGALREHLQQSTESLGSKLGQQESDVTQRIAKEQAQRGTAQRRLASSLEEGANRAKQESVTSLNKIAKPTDDYHLGSRLRKKVVRRQSELASAADNEAKRLKDIYLKEGSQKEKLGQYWSKSVTGNEFINYLKSVINPENSGKVSEGEVSAAKDLYNQLTDKVINKRGTKIPAELTKIESIIRETKKIPNLPAMSGADAAKQHYMRKLAQKLEDSVYGYVDEGGRTVSGFAPTGGIFRETYREMMKPINAYESPVGKVISQQVEGLKGIYSSDATSIPGAVFKSPQQIHSLERMGIKRQELEPFATQYTANQLAKLNKAEDVSKWLNSEKASYLKEFPELSKKAHEYASTFARNEAEVERSLRTAKQVKESYLRTSQQAKKDIEDFKRMSSDKRKEISDDLYKIFNAKNESNMASQARTYVLKLRKEGHISEEESADLLNKISRVEREVKDKERAKTAMKGLLPYGLAATGVVAAGGILGYSLNKIFGGF